MALQDKKTALPLDSHTPQRTNLEIDSQQVLINEAKRNLAFYFTGLSIIIGALFLYNFLV